MGGRNEDHSAVGDQSKAGKVEVGDLTRSAHHRALVWTNHKEYRWDRWRVVDLTHSAGCCNRRYDSAQLATCPVEL